MLRATVPFPVDLWLPLKTGSLLVAACFAAAALSLGFRVSLYHSFLGLIENMAQDNKGLIQESSAVRADVEGSTNVKSSWSGPREPQRVGLRLPDTL